MSYDHRKIESDMQKYWAEIDAFKTHDDSNKPKTYILDMFPYPSGAGLHIGHVEGYTATDIVSRYKRMNGFEVLHPMGWDAFGLPAENYAIKVGKHPRITTDENIQTFKRQLNSVGFSYDWSCEVDTSSEEYYKWSQWFFLFLYEKGLAYRKEAPVNWCNSCQTVLANEQVVNGKCERCKSEVVRKNLPQWFFKVTEYAQRLLDDLEHLDWPESLKDMQRNWIGRSEGAYIEFAVDGHDKKIKVFTTRPDTLDGATYMVLAPEHELVEALVVDAQKEAVKKYQIEAQNRSELERTGTDQKKTGVFTGAYAINPVNNEKIPIWIADYVLTGYGTGAIMAVPAHDERDAEFAKEYDLPIKEVDADASQEMKERLTKQAGGEMAVTFRIRDWLVSRQRFWGAPIPIIYCDDCGMQPVPVDQLPVRLPKEADFELKGDGKSPLGRVEEFVNVDCPKCGKAGRRETDTMDGFVDNSWYYFRFIDPTNDEIFADREKVQSWMPIDLYVGGAEHAVGHLIYSRFFTKVLFDHDYLNFEEPFTKLVNQGLILAEDGLKMSKSLGNVVNPDDVISEFGADCLRMYEMFLGPLTEHKPWDTKGILGVRRFLDKVHKYFMEDNIHKGEALDQNLTAQLHKTIAKVTDDIENLRFNTAIAAMMSFVNAITNSEHALPKVEAEEFLRLLSPFAPHLAEYLWQQLGNDTSLGMQTWPAYDERLLKEKMTVIAVQINGKVRDKVSAPTDADEDEVKSLVLASDQVAKYLKGEEIKKVIFVKNRIINFII